MKKTDFVLLLLIVILAIAMRLYRINTPLADFHSWRQADTAAVARNFVRSGFDLMHPKYDDLTSIQSGIDNPQGYRFVEFPIYNVIFAGLYNLSPAVPIEVYGRLTSIFFSLLIIICVYYLALKEIGRTAALASSLVYAIFPFFVFFSRVVLPETTALGFTFISITLLYLFVNAKREPLRWILFLLSALSFASALLVKPTVIFYGVALLYLFIARYKFDIIKRFDVYLFFAISIVPVFLWRNYILGFPEGIPASDWLITSVNTSEGLKSIFFRPAFFRWIFFERINNIIFGGYATFFLILGLASKNKSRFLMFLTGSVLAYLFVFQGGNVQHEYYQTLILPILAIATGGGVELFFGKKFQGITNRLTSIVVVFVVFVMSFLFSYNHVKGYYDYPKDLSQVARLIQTFTKPDDLIITDTTGDTTLLYLADRRGAPAQYKELPEMKNIGYSYLISFEKEKTAKLKEEGIYPIIFENDALAIFHL